MSTIVLTLLFLGVIAASIVLWAYFLQLGLRWACVVDPSLRRVAWATAMVFLLQLPAAVIFYSISPESSAPSLIYVFAELSTAILIPLVVIMRVFKTRLLQSAQIWLPTLLAPVLTIGFTLLVVRPFFVEAFSGTTNVMAPTLLGNHWIGTCKECGQPAYCSPVSQPLQTPERPVMICRDNFHVTQPPEYASTVHGADRFLAAKFLNPRRWDPVVFRYPADPTRLYVMRVVGLPGEEIVIRDGRVWANDELLAPPVPIEKIQYLADMGPEAGVLWGTPDKPAQLSDDEYFVLGDYSARSLDSRLWQEGAPDRKPFAVPKSNLQGVVTHIYWPPHRWQILR